MCRTSYIRQVASSGIRNLCLIFMQFFKLCVLGDCPTRSRVSGYGMSDIPQLFNIAVPACLPPSKYFLDKSFFDMSNISTAQAAIVI